MYKYILLLVFVFFSCKDKSVEPTGDTPNDPVNDNYVIAYDTPGEGNVYIYNASTKALVRVTSMVVDTSYFAFVSSFSDNGHELLYTLDYRKPGKEDWLFCLRDDIFSYNLITGKTVRLSDTEFQERKPKYSKDGEHIIYESSANGNSDIYMIDRSGNNKKLLVSNPGYEHNPQFVMDDKKIFYSSYRDGKSEFYLNDINGDNEEQLTYNGLGGEASVSSNNDFFVCSAAEGIYKYDFASRTSTLLIPNPNTTDFDLNLNPKISGDSKYILYINTLGPMSHAYLYNFESKNKIDMGIVFVGDFTKDSKNIVSLQRDGMHLFNIYSRTDSILVRHQILSFDMVVSSLK